MLTAELERSNDQPQERYRQCSSDAYFRRSMEKDADRAWQPIRLY
jgi:hypothetical protein